MRVQKLRVLLFAVCIFCSFPVWSLEDEDPPLYGRAATNQEIVGVWRTLPNPGRQYQYQYVAITADGRIGWVWSRVEPKVINQIAVVEMIEYPDKFGVQSTGWESYVYNDRTMTTLAKNGGNHKYSFVTLLTKDMGPSNNRFWGRPGSEGFRAAGDDLILQTFYRPPAMANPNLPPIHIQQPTPDYLRRIAH